MHKVISAFGLKDVALAVAKTDGSTPTWVDVPAILNANFKQTVQEVEQNGDDKYLGTFRYNQKGMISVKATKASMEVFELVSGNVASSLAGGRGMIVFGTNAEKQPPFLCARATIDVLKEDGTTGQLYAYWFKTQAVTPFSSFPDGAYGKLAEVQFDLTVFKTLLDEVGHPANPFDATDEALGRIEFP